MMALAMRKQAEIEEQRRIIERLTDGLADSEQRIIELEAEVRDLRRQSLPAPSAEPTYARRGL